MRIAVTGGTGFVGATLIEHALAQGHDIAALTRRPQAERPGVDWVSGELGDKQALQRLVGGADLVIHVAGVINAANSAAFEAGNVTGTLNLIEAARAVGPQRLIHVSTLAAREPEVSRYGASKAQGEKLVKASALDWTIVRPPAVYGPRDSEMLELFRAAKWGLVPMPRRGRASIVHVADLVRLLLAMPQGGEALTGKTFEPDDGVAGGWDHHNMALAIGQALGKRPSVMGVSRRWMEAAARIDGLFRRSKAKMTMDRAAYFSHPDWVVSNAARPPRDIWEPQIETRSGLAATAQWYREQGWL